MKTIIMALAATTALAAASPAAAQYGGGYAQLRTDQLQGQLRAGIQSGAIDRVEAVSLRNQLGQLTRLERQYSQGGFTIRERSDLQNRMTSLRQEIAMAARNGGGRYDRDPRYGDAGYGRDCPPGLDRRDNGCLPPGQVGRDDGNGRWSEEGQYARGGQMMDANRDGYDDRDLNRDRRIDDREWQTAGTRYGSNVGYDRDDRDDRDERYADRDTRRDGIGGVIDDVLGRGGLQVGQRASADLGGVPYAYRDQYRDGNGVYYRSDNRAIYQIDARSGTVLRIYALNR